MQVLKDQFYREAKEIERDYVQIEDRGGCSSFVGKKGNGKQILSLGRGCFWNKTIAHEFMHAFGFDHEQNRPDRDNYIKIQKQNIIGEKHFNFKKQKNSLTFGVPYDGLSIMHYKAKAFSKNGGPTIISLVIIFF